MIIIKPPISYKTVEELPVGTVFNTEYNSTFYLKLFSNIITRKALQDNPDDVIVMGIENHILYYIPKLRHIQEYYLQSRLILK